MAKKTKKPEYADDLHSPQEYILAWLIGGGSLKESLEFEKWIHLVEFNGMKLSTKYIREIVGEFYRWESNGASNLALMALYYRYNRLKSGIISDISLQEFNKEFNEKYGKGDN